MIETFEKLYRTMGRATAGSLIGALALFGMALCLALLGFQQAESLGQVAKAMTLVFVGLLSLFLVTSLVAAIVRWLDRRSRPIAKTGSGEL
jgi:hypothetical protein